MDYDRVVDGAGRTVYETKVVAGFAAAARARVVGKREQRKFVEARLVCRASGYDLQTASLVHGFAVIAGDIGTDLLAALACAEKWVAESPEFRFVTVVQRPA